MGKVRERRVAGGRGGDCRGGRKHVGLIEEGERKRMHMQEEQGRKLYSWVRGRGV